MYVYRPPFILLLLYCYQIDSSLNTLTRSLLTGLSFLMALRERYVYHLVVFYAYHDISLILP